MPEEQQSASISPLLSKYILNFGKHRSECLVQVPDMHLVKYLIPHKDGFLRSLSKLFEAVDDYMKEHPGLESQAGPGKAVARKHGIPSMAPRKRKQKLLHPQFWDGS